MSARARRRGSATRSPGTCWDEPCPASARPSACSRPRRRRDPARRTWLDTSADVQKPAAASIRAASAALRSVARRPGDAHPGDRRPARRRRAGAASSSSADSPSGSGMSTSTSLGSSTSRSSATYVASTPSSARSSESSSPDRGHELDLGRIEVASTDERRVLGRHDAGVEEHPERHSPEVPGRRGLRRVQVAVRVDPDDCRVDRPGAPRRSPRRRACSSSRRARSVVPASASAIASVCSSRVSRSTTATSGYGSVDARAFGHPLASGAPRRGNADEPGRERRAAAVALVAVADRDRRERAAVRAACTKGAHAARLLEDLEAARTRACRRTRRARSRRSGSRRRRRGRRASSPRGGTARTHAAAARGRARGGATSCGRRGCRTQPSSALHGVRLADRETAPARPEATRASTAPGRSARRASNWCSPLLERLLDRLPEVRGTSPGAARRTLRSSPAVERSRLDRRPARPRGGGGSSELDLHARRVSEPVGTRAARARADECARSSIQRRSRASRAPSSRARRLCPARGASGAGCPRSVDPRASRRRELPRPRRTRPLVEPRRRCSSSTLRRRPLVPDAPSLVDRLGRVLAA